MTEESGSREIVYSYGFRAEVVERYSDGTAWIRYLEGPKQGQSRTVMLRSLRPVRN